MTLADVADDVVTRRLDFRDRGVVEGTPVPDFGLARQTT
jgi:hypothetical protein